MRDIEIKVDSNGYAKYVERFIGNQYENDATQLVFDLPAEYVGKDYFHYAVFTLSNDMTIIRHIVDNKCIIDRDITNVAGLTLLQVIVKNIEGADDLSDGLVICSQPISCYIKETSYNTDNISNESIDKNVVVLLEEFDALLAEMRNTDASIEENLNKYTRIVKKQTDALNQKIAQITDNASDMAEVIDARGDFTNLGLRLNAKPYYFDNVADMKASNLKAGDYALTNGYYDYNDGGCADYLIRVKKDSDVEDNGLIHFLDNGLVAELSRGYKCYLKQLGAISEDDTKGRLNITAIYNAIENDLEIDLCGETFYIESNETISITKNIVIENGKLIISNKTSVSCIFNLNDRIDLKMNNIKIESFTKGTTFYSFNINPNTIKIKNSYFKGNLSLIRHNYISGTSDPINDEAIESIIFSNNKCENIEMSFLKFNDTKFNYFEISKNEIHNFNYVFCHTGIDNNYEYGSDVSENMKELIVRDNYVHNDIDYDVILSNGDYFCFILSEGDICVYENNHVEGLHTTSNVTCGDGYFSAHTVYYRNNINKNNLVITEEDNANYFFKAKGGRVQNLGYGLKYCENNKFILEKEYANKLNVDTNFVRVGLIQAVSEQKLYFRNNIISSNWLFGTNGVSNACFKELVFTNNKINCHKIGYTYNTEVENFFNINNSNDVNISNNEMIVEDSTGFSFIYCSDKLIDNLTVNNNKIKGNIISFLRSLRSNMIICKGNIVSSEIDSNKTVYMFNGLRSEKAIIEDNTIYQKNGIDYLTPISYGYFSNCALFNCKYITPFKSSFSTEKLTDIGNQTYYFEMIIKTKNKTYKGHWYIKGVIENDEQKLYIIPHGSTEEREIISSEWKYIALEEDDNLGTIIRPQIGGTNKVLSWAIQNNYIANTILDIEINIKTI